MNRPPSSNPASLGPLPAPSSSQYPPIQSSAPPNNMAWSNQYQGYPMKGNDFVQNQNHWNHSHSSRPPPPPSQSRFSQPPPTQPHNHFSQPPQSHNFSQSPPSQSHHHFSQPAPPQSLNNFSQPLQPSPFSCNRPPPPMPVVHSESGQPPSSGTNNRLPHPTNFYQPPPHADINMNRPPPPIPNLPPQSYQPPPHQGFPPPSSNGGVPSFINSNQQPPFPFHPSHPLSMPPPPQHHNNNPIVVQHQQQQPSSAQLSQPANFPKDIFEISNASIDKEVWETEIEKKRKIGRQRLASWLQKSGKAKKKDAIGESRMTPPTPTVKLNEYLCKLQNYMTVIAEMSGQADRLDSIVSEADKPMWQQECCAMDTLKDKHKDLKSVLDRAVVEQAEKKLNETRQRRVRLRKSRRQQFQQIQEVEEARRAKEKDISDWQQRLLSEMKEDLMKKKRKQEMDQTLSEVTKKIHDANRLIDTMTALEKLRLIRQDAATKRGDIDVGESRESFEQKICDMNRLVRSQLEVYREEEEQLRTAIKSEQEETSKKEQQLQASKDEEEQRQKDEELRKMLFGASEDADISDPLFPYQQYYKHAQSSLPAFLHIRHEWDQYAVPASDPSGSSVPAGWVLPPDPPSSTDWASALV